MSLSERLREARTQKLIESGVLPHVHTARVEPDDPAPVLEVITAEPDERDDAHGLFAPITIEARPVGLHLVPTTIVDLTTRDDDEDSSMCPNCHGVGLADMVDLVGHTVHYTCASCSTMWQVHKHVVHDSVAR